MTKTLGVNANNDIYLGADGNLVVLIGLPAVLQLCEHAVKAVLGEMVLATDQGVPYFQTVWVGVPNFQQFSAALSAAILGVQDVTNINSLVLTQTGNILNYVAEIATIYGVGGINGAINTNGI